MVLASAQEVLEDQDAAAHAAVIAHTITETAARMRDDGLGAPLVSLWLEATVSAARHRLVERTALLGSDIAH